MGLGDWIGEHWKLYKEGWVNLNRLAIPGALLSDLGAIATSDASWKDKSAAAIGYGKQQAAYAGMVSSPVTDISPVKWLSDKFTWLQKNTVNRPLSTMSMALGPAQFGVAGPAFIPNQVYQNAPNPLSADTWRQAWNDSEKVTAGQAFTYQAGLATGQIPVDDPNFDPRQSKDVYYNDPFYESTSGGVDFLLSLVDPLRGAGKLAKLGKLRYLEGAVDAKKVASGALERQTFGAGAQYGQSMDEVGQGLTSRPEKLFQAGKNLDYSTFQKTYFNNLSQGPAVAAALSTAAKMDDRALFSDVLLASRGNAPAYERLLNSPQGTRFAEAMGQIRNVYNVSNTTVMKADDAFARQIADMQLAAHQEAWINQWIDSDVAGTPELGWADVKSAMIGRGTPRRTIGQLLGNGVKMAAEGSGYVPSTVARWTDPSKGYAAHLEVNLSSSLRQFRANLERAGDVMDNAVRDRYLAAYGAALTPNERSRIASMADNFLIGQIAAKYGLSQADIGKIVQETSLRRQTMRQLLNASQRYMPKAFIDQADKLARRGAVKESRKLQILAAKYKDMVQRGELPADAQFLADDRGRLVVVPAKLDPDNPLLTSQAADYLPMTDYRKLDRTMRRVVEPKVTVAKYEADRGRIESGAAPLYNISDKEYAVAKRRAAVGLAVGTTEDFYKAMNKAWSVAAVLRPGQTIRTLADDGMRAVSLMGVLPMLTSGTKGLGRVAYNISRRGTTWMQDRQFFKALRANRSGNDVVDVDRLGEDTSLANAPSDSAGFYQQRDPTTDITPRQLGSTTAYQTLEAALVNGRIDLNTYISHAQWAVAQGRAPFELQSIMWEFENGLIKRETMRNDIKQYLLDATGRSAFASPRWQQDVADAVNELGFDDPRGLLVNPLIDDARRFPDRRLGEDYEIRAHTELHTNPTDDPETYGVFDDLDGLYDFVIHNAEEFLSGAQLHIKQLPNSKVRLQVVRHKDMAPPLHETMSKNQKLALAKGLRKRGSTGVTIRQGGRTVEIPGSMAGLDGDFARSAASARPNDMPWQVLLSMRAGDRVDAMSNRVSAKDLLPENGRDYAEAWERSVNAQLSNDAVARQFLEGRSEGQVLDWVEGTPAGQRWLLDRGQRTMDYDQVVGAIHGLVDHLVPEAGGQVLRDKVLNKEATVRDLEAAVPDESMRPAVNGHVTEVNLGTHPALRWASKQLDKWFRWMQDKPSDTLVRFPFFDMSYRKYMDPMVKTYLAQLPEGAIVHQGEVERLARLARQQAIMDTRQYLYDATFRTDAASALGAVMPFSQAVADSVFKWLKIAREKPFDVAANFNLLYSGPERAGLVYDQDGNHLTMEDGKEVWRAAVTGEVVPDVDKDGKPYQHERFIAFAVPSTIKQHLLGRDAIEPTVFSKSSMTNAIFDPSVNVAPILALPANHFALDHPEFGENSLVKKFVLPFGPQSDELKTVLPGLVRGAYTWYKDDRDQSKASSSAMAIYQQMLTDYGTGKRTTRPTIQEAQHKAFYEQALRFLTSASSPVSTQQVNPYKPFTDYYNALLKKHDYDEDAALTEFRNGGMYDDFIYQTARVTKTNIAIPSTIAGYKKYQQYKDAIRKYPDLAGLITGRDGSGSFSKAVYEWEKNQTYDESGQTIRQEMGIGESIDDVKKRIGWNDYTKFMATVHNDLEARGLSSVRDRGAEDILQNYRTWIGSKVYDQGPNGEVELSPWYTDFKNTDETYMENRLTEMRSLLSENENWLQGRDELQGLAQYFQLRDQIKQSMADNGYATLDSQKADWLQQYWQGQVWQLKNGNNAFAQLYDRWLTRDNLGADGLAANEILSLIEGGGGNG